MLATTLRYTDTYTDIPGYLVDVLSSNIASLDLSDIPQPAADSNLLSELQKSKKIKLSNTKKSVRDQLYQLWVSVLSDWV